jgi:hypothetical protein
VNASPVRRVFDEQARACAALGSNFTALLCEVLGETLDRTTNTGRRVFDGPGKAGALHDNIPLRLAGAFHALVRSGKATQLAALYPPRRAPDRNRLANVLKTSLEQNDRWLAQWLERPPQTNEVGRSAVLMSGLLEIANRFGSPIHLLELGASAGLNMNLDAYGYELGGSYFGRADSPIQLRPRWRGAGPPRADVEIIARAGVDRDPLDPEADREVLIAYVWPDQSERLQRLEAALDVARNRAFRVDKGDAADWLDEQLTIQGEGPVTRVVMHSIAFQYFSAATRSRIERRIEMAGAAATSDAAVAWLRFEMLPEDDKPSLRLKTWPGDEQLLAWAHPHGTSISWAVG